MTKHLLTAIILMLGLHHNTWAQEGNELTLIRQNVAILTDTSFHGRGYVREGHELASAFLQRKYVEYGLKPLPDAGNYVQTYTFPVNTFPGAMEIVLDGKTLKPGADYIVDVASVSFSGTLPVGRIDLSALSSQKQLNKTIGKLDEEHIWILDGLDSCAHKLGFSARKFAATLPRGCFIVSQASKLTWDVAQDTIDATVLYVKADALPAHTSEATIKVDHKFISRSKNDNIAGYVKGTAVPDSYIVFTAHYDHLGMMGTGAVFPGASDNASGTAMMLYLASYFSRHPLRHSVAFIAFSGEEAGLVGSGYFVQHPMLPLSHIRFLTNVDIMGDATDGVTAVNATVQPAEFGLLNHINDSAHYIPVIKSRGRAANSDHYFFSEAGVPAFFLYSNGGKGYYHDIFDIGPELTLEHVDGVARLLKDFAAQLCR